MHGRDINVNVSAVLNPNETEVEAISISMERGTPIELSPFL